MVTQFSTLVRSCLWDDQGKKPMKANVTACWRGVRFLSKTSHQTNTGNFLFQLGSENNNVRPHQTAERTLPHLCKLTAICIKLISDVDRMQRKNRGCDGSYQRKVRKTDNTWNRKQVRWVELSWGSDSWWEWEAAGWLPLLTSLLFFFPFLSQLQQGFLHLRLRRRFTPSTPLHPDRNIAYAESSLIASSTSRHLATPSPLKKWLDFIIFDLSNSCRVTLLSTLRLFIPFSTKLFHITNYDSINSQLC